MPIEFIMCGFGISGRVSDGGVLKYRRFYEGLKNHTLHVSSGSKPDNSQNELPFLFIGDEAFALQPDFLNPFNQEQLTTECRIV